MTEQKNENLVRFLLAAALSMVVLMGWSYFFAPTPPPKDANSNTSTAQTTPAAANTPAAQPAQPPAQQIATTPDTVPQKTVTIKTPLYEAKLDSKGAVATSWILIKNVSSHGEKLLFADAENGGDGKPLELISAETLSRNPRELPFRLLTGDQGLDSFINERNYQLSVSEENINLKDAESKKIDFVLKGEGGIEITKSFTFYADSNLTDLKIKATRDGQAIQNTKLLIGASVGDQGIKFHNYYHIEPEGVAYVNDTVDRHFAPSFFKKADDKNEKGSATVNGEVDWAGVGDTYFGMAAIPAQRTSGLEFHASKYEIPTEPYYDGLWSRLTGGKKSVIQRHLITAHVPINADGSVTKIYTGSKDYFTLSNDYDTKIEQQTGRYVHLHDFINFSNYSWFRPIIKPITIGLVWCLSKIYGVTGNYGLSVILFALIFYSLFFPLRIYQSRSFKKAQKNAPKMKEVQEKLKELQRKGIPADDPRMREIQMEQLRLTKDALPIGGCLPLLLQMPFFIAIYTAVTIALDFRQTHFLWLPDLSGADPWHLLEFLFAGSMVGSMMLMPQAPAVTPEQQMQQKMMMYIMPLFMLFVMWGYPAGLLMAWFFGNIVSFGQQMIINRMNKANEQPEMPQVGKTGAKTKA